MSLAYKTWPHGTTRKAVVLKDGVYQYLQDEHGEGHVLMGDARDHSAKPGDKGVLTFTKGGATGGYWKFTKDQP